MGKRPVDIRRYVFSLLYPTHNRAQRYRGFEVFSISLVLLNVLVVILETINHLHERYCQLFHDFEVFSVMVFTLEYLGRIWTADLNPHFRDSRLPRLRYVFSFMALVDLFSVVPFYLPMVIPFDLRVIRSIRLVRVFRILKVGHYSEELQLFARVFRAKKEELMITGFAGLVLLVVSSTVMYHVENPKQPEAFSSIPQAMWWSVTTLTTVGYGDTFPVTTLGRFLTGLLSTMGIGLFALPAGILGSGFYEEVRIRRQKPVVCPNCGHPLHGHVEHPKEER